MQSDLHFNIVINIPLLIFGAIANAILLQSIAKGTPNNMKKYSVLIFWGSINDLMSICADAMSRERLTFRMPTVIFIPNGPCTHISIDFCNICNSLIAMANIQSLFIQCISFWYRYRVLHKSTPKSIALNAIVIISAVPNIVHMILYTKSKDYDPALLSAVRAIYPKTNWTGVYLLGKFKRRFSNILKHSNSIIFGYFFVVVPVMFLFLIIMRNRIAISLKFQQFMSVKTLQMHSIFLKILTIHSLLPLSMIFGICFACIIVFGIYNPEYEAMILVMGMMPPALNPAVTIWYIKPYREYVTRNIFCSRADRFIEGEASSTVIPSAAGKMTIAQISMIHAKL